MISVGYAILLMFALGAVLDQGVLVVTRSKLSLAGKVFVLTIINFFFIMITTAVVYFVDGFDTGLLRWHIVVECFCAGYLWLGVASFWRFVTEDR